MALVGAELYSRDTSEMQHEILPDGTVHDKISLTKCRTDSLEKVAETIETFEHPPHLVQETEEFEEIMPDGTKVIRHVALKTMIHSVKTRHESFDGNSGRVVENYEVEEVVPNTMTAFDAGVDSDYEEEQQKKRNRSYSVDVGEEEIEEVMPDGTKVKRKVTLNRVVHVVRDRSESFDKRSGKYMNEKFPGEEVVPGTVSAFEAGQDSD